MSLAATCVGAQRQAADFTRFGVVQATQVLQSFGSPVCAVAGNSASSGSRARHLMKLQEEKTGAAVDAAGGGT